MAKLAISQLIQTDLPHAMTTSDEVTAGTRIEMLEKNNLKLGIPPESMSRVIFFTDAKSDVASVRHSKNPAWVVGISETSTHMEIASEEEAKTISTAVFQQKRQHATNLLLQNGAHCVIRNLSEAPLAIYAASRSLLNNVKPEQIQRLDITYPKLAEDKDEPQPVKKLTA